MGYGERAVGIADVPAAQGQAQFPECVKLRARICAVHAAAESSRCTGAASRISRGWEDPRHGAFPFSIPNVQTGFFSSEHNHQVS